MLSVLKGLLAGFLAGCTSAAVPLGLTMHTAAAGSCGKAAAWQAHSLMPAVVSRLDCTSQP
jgi:hypothetical protein